MTSNIKTALLLFLAITNPLASAHGAIVSATGDQGGTGMALGIDTSTPRDGTRRNPFQQDSTRFRGDVAETFGETLGGGDNQLEAGTAAIMAETGDSLPQVSAGGEVQMTLHQVNADGGGPYTCMISADGTGTDWTDIQVTTTPPGRRSRNRDGEATDFPLNAAIPADQECTGSVAGQDNVCLVRCQNDARAGPFGGVVPVQMAGSGGGVVNDTNSNNVNAGNNDNNNNDNNNNNANATDINTSPDEAAARRRGLVSGFGGVDTDEIAELMDDGEI